MITKNGNERYMTIFQYMYLYLSIIPYIQTLLESENNNQSSIRIQNHLISKISKIQVVRYPLSNTQYPSIKKNQLRQIYKKHKFK